MNDTRPPRGKRILVAVGELAVALALVAVFFAIFVGIYFISFPDHTALGDMFRNPGEAWGGKLTFEMHGLSEDTPFTAWLTEVDHNVKEKPADGIVWNDARSGIPLGERHAVQSFARSGATISFGGGSRLQLGANSLIVIRDTRHPAGSRKRAAKIVVLGGEVRGKLSPSADEPLVVEIAGAKGTLRVESGSKQATEFKVTTDTDDTSTFAVYVGEARVDAAGRTIELGSNQSVTIDPEGRIGPPRPLRPAPAAISPADRSVVAFRSASPVVDFAWEPRGADSCRFVLARDAELRDVLHDAVTAEGRFRHGGLRPGTYFWRVSGFDGAAEGPASRLRRFEVRADREPPMLQVRFPDGPIDGAMLDVVGRTEPGCEIFVGDLRVEPGVDGSFKHQIRLLPGANVVVVEAFDRVGNRTYASSVVRARFAVPESEP